MSDTIVSVTFFWDRLSFMPVSTFSLIPPLTRSGEVESDFLVRPSNSDPTLFVPAGL